MADNRKIAIVTGSRAEYGLLYWLIKEVAEDPVLDLQLIVTGMHLSAEFGYTVNEIEKDGFEIAYKVDSLVSSDSSVAITKSVGLGVIGFADAYAACNPDIIVVLGDRHEILAAGVAALTMRIPMAHIHGGETTPAMLDGPIRHCLTKLSHLHFPAADEYAKRIHQLGEPKERIFAFGGPGLDHLDYLDFIDQHALSADLGIDLSKPYAVITYHPVTLQGGSIKKHYQSLLQALGHFPDLTFIFTASNSDHEGREVFNILHDYQENCQRDNVKVFTTLGYQRYISLAKNAAVVIGNSSSGLIEIPHMSVPTVNIGSRQDSRLKPNTVIDCSNTEKDIVKAIQLALSDKFKYELEHVRTPYKKGEVSKQIKEVLKSFNLDDILRKEFQNW